MRIAFLSPSHVDFTPHTPRTAPLGGSESAACHVALALAERGHAVSLLANTSSPGVYGGVEAIRWGGERAEGLEQLRALRPDVAILLRLAPRIVPLKAALPGTPLLLWAQDDPAQPSVQPLGDRRVQAALAGIVQVSAWQREQFVGAFGLSPGQCHVIPNPIGPAFEGLFAEGEALLGQKTRPPVLAYTSTPFRGLSILLDVFPQIRAAVPGVTLKVFSSMRVYQLPEAQDVAAHGGLYERCRGMEGVTYVGSIPQPALAGELKGVSVLAYPNAFPETSCIAALEAMAAGVQIVSSALAALPETTAGFAQLLPLGPGYRQRFAETVVRVLTEGRGRPEEAEAHLQGQRRHVLAQHRPAALAARWETLLQGLLAS